MWMYYTEAIHRTFYAAINWALSQGLLLTFLMAFGVLVCAALIAIFRSVESFFRAANCCNFSTPGGATGAVKPSFTFLVSA
jgi:uncharacterized membrane protein